MSESGFSRKSLSSALPLAIAVVVLLLICVPAELDRFQSLEFERGWWVALIDWNIDTTPFLVLACLLPAFWWWPSRSRASRPLCRPDHFQLIDGVLILGVFVASLGVSAFVGNRPVGRLGEAFGSLPPAYHDEYSYLFQARTFLAGELAFPGHDRHPELFDQMHVLNEGRFASRYFPGTGIWMAPFVKFGHPDWGHWLAGALTAVLAALTARELAGRPAALVAGMSLAIAPGCALFANLLLAHHPALLGLALFQFAFLRMLKSGSVGAGITAGCGLTFAMLSRPMTAAGFALPAGVVLLIRFVISWRSDRSRPAGDARIEARKVDGPQLTGDLSENGNAPPQAPGSRGGPLDGLKRWVEPWGTGGRNRGASGKVAGPFQADGLKVAGPLAEIRMRQMLSVGVPVICGLLGLLAYNRATTGNPLETPYQLYTNIYTPRHVYGFNNVVRGERRLGPKVIEGYDTWAENLDGRLAAENMRKRWLAGWQWSLGIVPLAMVCVLFWPALPRSDVRWWLVVASILSLHAAHIPYWYSGILDHHYVFEAVLSWSILVGGVTAWVWNTSRQWGRSGLATWWTLMLVAAAIPSYMALPPFWAGSRIEAAVETTAFSKIKYARFHRLVERIVWNGRAPDPDRPALVLVAHDPLDLHLDLVDNPPGLDGPLLIGRYRAGETDLETICQDFPDRRVFLFDVRTNQLTAVPFRQGSRRQ